MESPRNFSLYIRIKNVCPLILNVTFVPFKDINLREKETSKIWYQKSIQPFSSYVYWFQSYGNARPIWMAFCLLKTRCRKNIPLFVYWWNSFLVQYWLTGCIHISRLSINILATIAPVTMVTEWGHHGSLSSSDVCLDGNYFVRLRVKIEREQKYLWVTMSWRVIGQGTAKHCQDQKIFLVTE